MPDDSQLTSYCGLYCLDCIPSRKELFAAAAHLQALLRDLQFDKYAELKAGHTYWSQANSVFRNYPQFLAVLQAIRGLECKSTCRQEGGWKGAHCAVRNCAMQRGFQGCWECAEYRSCQDLEPLLKFHPNLAHHLDLIRSEGIEGWASKRKSHYPW